MVTQDLGGLGGGVVGDEGGVLEKDVFCDCGWCNSREEDVAFGLSSC